MQNIEKVVRNKPAPQPLYLDSTFKSNDMNWLIFGLILVFDFMVFVASYKLALPTGLGGADFAQVEGIVYALLMVLLIAKVVFHQNWRVAEIHSPGPMVLIVNFMIGILLIDPFQIMYKVVIMKILICLLPILALAVMVMLLQREEDAPTI